MERWVRCSLFFLMGLYFALPVSSHAAGKPLWMLELPDSVLWQKVTPLGTLILATEKGLVGVNPQSGKILWKQDNEKLRNLSQDKIGFIPNTPFISVAEEGDEKNGLIINPADGIIVCDPAVAGIDYVDFQSVLFQSGNLLIVEGVRPNEKGFRIPTKKSLSIALFDITSGSVLWKKEKMFFHEAKLFKLKIKQTEEIVGSPLEDGTGSFVVATRNALYKIDGKNGDLVWRVPVTFKVRGLSDESSPEGKLLRDPKGSSFYFLLHNWIMAYDMETGNQAWKEATEMDGIASTVVFDPEGLIHLADVSPRGNAITPTLQMVDYKTGTLKWEKGAKVHGPVIHYKYTTKGLALCEQVSPEKAFLDLVDLHSGQSILKKPLKVKGEILEFGLAPCGIVYRTANEFNIFSLENENALYGKSIRASGKDGRVLVAYDKDVLFVLTTDNGLLQRIRLADGSIKTIVEKVQLKGKEHPNRLEMRSAGVMIGSPQNVMLIDREGQEKFAVYFAPPKDSGLMKALWGVSAALAAYDGIRYSASAAVIDEVGSKSTDPLSRGMYDGMGQAFQKVGDAKMAEAGQAMTLLKKRYGATAVARDNVYMLTRFDNSTVGLVKVAKDTGEKMAEINFGMNKEPVYSVDDITGLVFYMTTPKTLTCFKG